MNERIKELMWDAGLNSNYVEGFDSIYSEQLEKFADLLVRECAQVSEDDITDGDACCTNTADRIARQIKKHFGVDL